MKIALPTRNGSIDDHFGHCEYFTIISTDGKKIDDETRLDPPEGCGCKSNVVPLMAQMGVKIMLAGNIGQGAVNMLASHGITVVRGCSGIAREAVESWLAGQLQDSGKGCTQHGGECSH